MLRNVLVDRLLKGSFTSMQELEAAMEHAQVQLRGSHHAVALLHIRGYQEPFMEEMLMELDIVKINIRDRIQSLCGEGRCCMTLEKINWFWSCRERQRIKRNSRYTCVHIYSRFMSI